MNKILYIFDNLFNIGSFRCKYITMLNQVSPIMVFIKILFLCFCKNEQLVAVDYQTFCKRVLGTRRVSETRPMIQGKRIQCFKGLRLKRRP